MCYIRGEKKTNLLQFALREQHTDTSHTPTSGERNLSQAAFHSLKRIKIRIKIRIKLRIEFKIRIRIKLGIELRKKKE